MVINGKEVVDVALPFLWRFHVACQIQAVYGEINIIGNFLARGSGI